MSVTVNLSKGGTPDVKGFFCGCDIPEWMPPYSHKFPSPTNIIPDPWRHNPPTTSHGDASYGQGYLNLQFPLVPRLGDSLAHHWMGKGLRRLTSVGDKIYTNWVPQRSIVPMMYWEVTVVDPAYEGVYVKPIADRVSYDYDAKEWKYETLEGFDSVLSDAGIEKFPLGKPADGDTRWAIALPSDPKIFWGHDIPKIEEVDGEYKPTAGFDEYFGTVMLGYEIVDGSDELVSTLWKADFAIWSSVKCLSVVVAQQA